MISYKSENNNYKSKKFFSPQQLNAIVSLFNHNKSKLLTWTTNKILCYLEHWTYIISWSLKNSTWLITQPSRKAVLLKLIYETWYIIQRTLWTGHTHQSYSFYWCSAWSAQCKEGWLPTLAMINDLASAKSLRLSAEGGHRIAIWI